ncbi:MAG: DUF2784 domain-containing protein [Chitinophagaceae bacterium]|nr:DUF2784 domain-containing protein [Chitinophagaceae bacterium]
MLVFLNILYTIFHIVITLFNMVGWIFPKTRKLHLITIALTFGSWFILGFWYGFGYCFLTDWHWDVKKKLGETNLPSSFIKYFADRISGKDISANLVNNVTLTVFFITIILTIYYNFFHKKRRNTTQQA